MLYNALMLCRAKLALYHATHCFFNFRYYHFRNSSTVLMKNTYYFGLRTITCINLTLKLT